MNRDAAHDISVPVERACSRSIATAVALLMSTAIATACNPDDEQAQGDVQRDQQTDVRSDADPDGADARADADPDGALDTRQMPEPLTAATLEITGYLGPDTAPIPWIAFRDGDGPWERVQPDANGVYTFEATSGLYGIAWHCGLGEMFRGISVFYGTSAETMPTAFACREDPLYTLSGTVTGLADGELATIHTPDGNASASAMDATWSLDVRETLTRVVVRARADGAAPRYKPVDGIDVTAGTPVDIDMSDAVEGVVGSFSHDENHSVSASWRTAEGASVGMRHEDVLYFAPTTALAPGDAHQITISANQTDIVNEPLFKRAVQRIFRLEPPISPQPPTRIEADAEVTELGRTPVRLRGDIEPAGAQAYRLVINQRNPDTDVVLTWTLSATGRWMRENVTVGIDISADPPITVGGAIAMPDLTGVEGWDHGFDIVPEDTVGWTALVMTSNREDDLRWFVPDTAPGLAPPPEADGLNIDEHVVSGDHTF